LVHHEPAHILVVLVSAWECHTNSLAECKIWLS
jgi:hypothetical protein